MNVGHLYLILGGARSGKSRHAEALIEIEPGPWCYIATAQAYDEEMRDRIRQHRDRRGDGWHTIEAPMALGDSLSTCDPEQPVLVDCLTLWLTNLMLADGSGSAGAVDRVAAAVEELFDALDRRHGKTVLVSNEVGLGIVPENRLARAFRDEAGRLHRKLAERAQSVHFLVAGIPMIVKEPT